MCTAATCTPPDSSARITGATSAVKSTRSPIAIAPLPCGMNANQVPSAKPGFTVTLPTVTARSERGKANLITPPGCGAPERPSACSTACQSVALAGCCATLAAAAAVRRSATRQ